MDTADTLTMIPGARRHSPQGHQPVLLIAQCPRSFQVAVWRQESVRDSTALLTTTVCDFAAPGQAWGAGCPQDVGQFQLAASQPVQLMDLQLHLAWLDLCQSH